MCGYELDINAEANAKATKERLAEALAEALEGLAHAIPNDERLADMVEALDEAEKALADWKKVQQ
jgi:hypothetical protein